MESSWKGMHAAWAPCVAAAECAAGALTAGDLRAEPATVVPIC